MTVLRHEAVPLAEKSRWCEALEGVPHPPALRWDYCAAMARSSGLDTLLYRCEGEGQRTLCSLSVRRKEKDCADLVSPYGFGGIVTNANAEVQRRISDGWRRFFRERGFVTSYVMQNPSFPLDRNAWGRDLGEGQTVYVINLTVDLEQLWQRMCKTHRYEIRRWQNRPDGNLASNRDELEQALKRLYPETVERVGAGGVYRFPYETIEQLARADGSLATGVARGGEIEAVALFVSTRWSADYFLNASTEYGRRYSRVLVWSAIGALKAMGVRVLNLGGGVRPGDSLDDFKRRFGGSPVRNQVLKSVLDKSRFDYLSRKFQDPRNGETGYFPSYWSPAIAERSST